MINLNTEKLILVDGQPVVLTVDTIRKTCDFYAQHKQCCIDEVLRGTDKVNNVEQYIKDCTEQKEQYLSGNFEPWLGFWQQAYFIQSGQSVPLIS
jgi:hypothetical protein